MSKSKSSNVYVACVPHVPLLEMQDKEVNPDLWQAYEARVAEYKAFDPELTFVFGGDHYDGVHLKLMPTFIVGQVAEALDDCGGKPGKLDIPKEEAFRCAEHLMGEDFDIATSYDFEVDHGFSNVMSHFIGDLDARKSIPLFINSMCAPRPTLRRCRLFGEAVGRYAKTLGKRVAFLGSGGLSHQTNFIFPQYDTAPNEDVLNYIVSGGTKGPITRDQWMNDIHEGMVKLSGDLVSGEFKAPWINEGWDQKFLELFAAGDMSVFDSWTDEEVLEAAGYGGGEIRMWIAAMAAAQAAGTETLNVDFYSPDTKLAIGAGVAHAV